MRLLGLIEEKNKELQMVEENGRVFVSEQTDRFDSYQFIKQRNKPIGKGIDVHTSEGLFKFRYGPVTAGIMEAGVFNLYTYGERIVAIEIDTTYKHRGIESLMLGNTPQEAIELAESVCSNFAFSHSLAFSLAVENVMGLTVSSSTKKLRMVLLELERIYNHILVMANLARAAAQNVLSSHLEWMFEESLRINELLTSSRFLQGANGIGKIRINTQNLETLLKRLSHIKERFTETYEHALKSWNFIDRLYSTAILEREKAYCIGITGPTAKASGIACDLRSHDNNYKEFHPITETGSDALARMEVRANEVLQSIDIITETVNNLDYNDRKGEPNIVADGKACGACESPSGLLAYYLSMEKGRIVNAYISPPSLFGFKAFAESIVGQIFTDFSFAYDSFGINFADCAR